MNKPEMPSSRQLMDATLSCLKSCGGQASNQQILDWVIAKLALTESQVTAIRSGNRTELDYRLAWARTAARKSGLIERRGPSNWALLS